MSRDIKNGLEVRDLIKKGMDKVSDTVRVTLGASGKNVVLDTNQYADPIVTNDGVTIARELMLSDKFENIGAKLIRQVAAKTNDVAGDGTTTATILMHAIVSEGMKSINTGADAVQVRKGIEKASGEVISKIKLEAVKAESLDRLVSTATISCGDEELGRLIAEVVQKAGKEGMVTLEDSPAPGTEYESHEGMKVRGGYQFPIFVTNPESQQAVFKDVPILVTNQPLTLAPEMVRIMETAASMGKKECVIVANSIEGDALQVAVMNWMQGKFRALPVRVVAYGDTGTGLLEDVAAITGATFIDGLSGKKVEDITQGDLGVAKKFVATKSESTVVSDSDESKAERIKVLKGQLKSAEAFEKESLEERIAKMNSAMYTIKVGGVTETEQKERKLRVEDAVNATKAAMEDGVVAGGGSALYRAGTYFLGEKRRYGSDELAGYQAVLSACRQPIKQMAENASVEIGMQLLDLSDQSKTIDFRSGEVVDAFDQGIIDPVKVVVSALENAASGAALFLTTEAGVVLSEEPTPEKL